MLQKKVFNVINQYLQVYLSQYTDITRKGVNLEIVK